MNTKNLSVVVVLVLITVSAMAALVAEKMRPVKVCKDVRVAMDGAIDAVVENSGLSNRYAVTLFKNKNYKKIKIGTIDVAPEVVAKGRAADSYLGDGLRLTIGKNVNPKTGRQPASLQGEIEGQQVSVAMGCGN
jgi:hypothetical protein